MALTQVKLRRINWRNMQLKEMDFSRYLADVLAVEKLTTGDIADTGAAGGGYEGSVKKTHALKLLNTVAKAVRAYVCPLYSDSSNQAGTNVFARVVYLVGNDVTALTDYTQVSNTARATAFEFTATTIPSGALLAVELHVPNGQTFRGAAFVEVFPTTVPA